MPSIKPNIAKESPINLVEVSPNAEVEEIVEITSNPQVGKSILKPVAQSPEDNPTLSGPNPGTNIKAVVVTSEEEGTPDDVFDLIRKS